MPELLHSAVLESIGVPHAFTTRRGGVSRPPFESLNLGNPSDIPAGARDPAANIHENWRLVLGSIGCGERRLVEVHQVHGAAVHTARRGEGNHTGADPRADGVVTDDPGVVVAVRVADCAPVLLTSGDGRIVGVAHAGWRGVIAGVVPNTVEMMKSMGAVGIGAAVGPCIGAARFEVGPEVVEQFREAFPECDPVDVRGAAPGKGFVDLKAVIRAQLVRAGVGMIDVLGQCTHRDSELFFSHRRDKGLTGRTAGLIGARA